MGYNNDIKTIFGMKLTKEHISKIEEKLNDKNIWTGEYTIKEFPEVFLGLSRHY